MGLRAALALMALGLFAVLFEQIRLSRLPPEKRAHLYSRRSFGRRQPRDPDAYLRRFAVVMVMCTLAGALFVILIATSPGPGHSRMAVVSALVVTLILAVFGLVGLLNHKRISEDSKAGVIPSDNDFGAW